MKTVEQWLNTLEEPYRTKALLNAEKDEFWEKYKTSAVNSIGFAIVEAFVWDATEEGFDYWISVASGGKP